ncbi:DUF305 domain-containing protein [uncultured Brevundimonas sp.]|uniref:DUF305 domain-containing protein n=1 Tax=uncultured Brevundimonas sp. TaxID=213418 RepID=UPI002617B2B0|nr:DUF305 domain-containing protein [uncultured Brevundimonas sp.]
MRWKWTLTTGPITRFIVFATLSLALAACDGGGDPVRQALRDVSAANHAATVREGEVTTTVGTASGGTADEAYIARMIEHHRGAVAMADVALARSRDPEIRRMARAVKDAQTREIAEMQAWRPAAQPTP